MKAKDSADSQVSESSPSKQIKSVLDSTPKRLVDQVSSLLENAVRREMTEIRESLDGISALGDFLQELFGTPKADPPASRMSLREDSALRDICHHLSSTAGTIRLFDVGCGAGNLPFAVLEGLNQECIRRIHYFGVDCDQSSVNELRRQHDYEAVIVDNGREKRTFRDLASFSVEIADVLTMKSTAWGRFDLIICHNVIHEIAPFSLPQILCGLNEMLQDGESPSAIAIVDMARLPDAYPECRAFAWAADDFRSLVRAAGYSHEEVIHHTKTVPVFSTFLHRVPAVDQAAALSVVVNVATNRIKTKLAEFKNLPPQELLGPHELKRRVSILAEIAHIAACFREQGIPIVW